MADQAKENPVRMERRLDLDWLRILSVLALFFFHSARIFDIYWPFYAKSPETSPALTYLFIEPITPWQMPLLFFLAGAASWYALGFRSAGQYAKERLTRLLIPFIFGLLVLIPPQSYYGWLDHGGRPESYTAFYPHFFQIIPQDLDGYFLGGFTMGHLWFIFYLFVYSLAGLPLFMYLRKSGGVRLRRRLASFLNKSGAMYLLAVPPTIFILMTDFYPNPGYFLTWFLYGFVMVSDPGFEAAVQKTRFPALIMGPVMMVIGLTLIKGFDLELAPWALVVLRCYQGLLTWTFLLAILGYGRQGLNFSNAFLRYFREGSYPVYVLHQTVIIVLGYYVVRSGCEVWFEFGVIVAGSFLITLGCYEFVARRFGPVRFLFGLKRPRTGPGLSQRLRGKSRGRLAWKLI